MIDGIELFKKQYPSLESYWRSIILFGNNVASYKFALAKSLLEIAPTGKTEITLQDLADPFSRHICEHIAHSPRQATSKTSKFLEACRLFNNGELTREALLDTTARYGFNNVIDAFHTVNGSSIPTPFYIKDYSQTSKKIVLTDDAFKLLETPFVGNLSAEVESRWNLVETAWELSINRSLLKVQYDDKSKKLFVEESFRRKDITSSRGALNGYQKGKCFYCFDDITVSDDSTNTCDVDHFFPHMLQPLMPNVNLDGVWNLVLACPNCNRGVGGKFALIPATKYLDRLHRRNEFLISSHHPLRETIIAQTGLTETARRAFLNMIDQASINALIHRWEIPQKKAATF